MDRRSFLSAVGLAAAGCAVPKCGCGKGGVRLKKLGTYDIFIVEANPIAFNGRLWLTERAFCESFFRP